MSVDSAWLSQQFPQVSGLKELGRGGQKWVYTGTHPTEGEVVIKIFKPSPVADRADREVQAVQNINSPRIPKVFEIGRARANLGEVIWLREQRIPGSNLRHKLKSGPLDPKSVLRLGLHVLEALAAAEQARIVHRDVKPDNILMDAGGNFWLLDFGLARLLDEESLTATGAAFGVGTAGYSPPEQFRNRKSDIDARSDLFALGVTLYECAEGTNPLRAGARDFAEILTRVETQPLPELTKEIEPSRKFRDLVTSLTRIRQDHRPVTAAEAYAWMKEICDAEGMS
jgi:serine/threonine-protein kinase